MLPHIKTILHATDFSERSLPAFELACSLARDLNARLVVLHVAVPPLAVYGEGMIATLPAVDLDEVRKHLTQIKPADPGVKVEHRLVEGEAVQEILREARDVGCDLVVIGTHGRTGLDRLLLGSVAEQVMRKAPCPVLTVRMPFPRKASDGEVKEVSTAPPTYA
jgi:nucleotide-binding universal stress UspA family protein